MIRWDGSKSSDNTICLYMEYILLMHNDFVKEDFKKVDVTISEFLYLYTILNNEVMSQRDLANFFFVSEANVTKMLNKLQKKQLITKVVDENNKTRKLIHLTDKGIKKTQMLFDISMNWENRLTEKYSRDDILKFKEMLFDFSKISFDMKH